MSILNLILYFWFLRYICLQPVQRLWLWNNCLHSVFIFCLGAPLCLCVCVFLLCTTHWSSVFPVDSTWRRLTTMVPGRRLRLWQTCTHPKQGRQWRFWTLQQAPAWWAKRWHHLFTWFCYYTGNRSYRAAHYMYRSYKLYVSPISEKKILWMLQWTWKSRGKKANRHELSLSRSHARAHTREPADLRNTFRIT